MLIAKLIGKLLLLPLLLVLFLMNMIVIIAEGVYGVVHSLFWGDHGTGDCFGSMFRYVAAGDWLCSIRGNECCDCRFYRITNCISWWSHGKCSSDDLLLNKFVVC